MLCVDETLSLEYWIKRNLSATSFLDEDNTAILFSAYCQEQPAEIGSTNWPCFLVKTCSPNYFEIIKVILKTIDARIPLRDFVTPRRLELMSCS